MPGALVSLMVLKDDLPIIIEGHANTLYNQLPNRGPNNHMVAPKRKVATPHEWGGYPTRVRWLPLTSEVATSHVLGCYSSLLV